MEGILQAIYNAIIGSLAKWITNKIARVFKIEEDTPRWRNIHDVLSLVLGVGISVAIFFLIVYLAKQYAAK